jgi:two-component system, NarL family, sensor kinase
LSQEIRTMSYLLHPPLLEEAGLADAIEWYTQGLTERSGLQISLTVSQGFGRLSHELELVMFRIVQECLTNIHRHSESKQAEILLERKPEGVLLKVQDRGKGMSPEKLSEIRSRGSGVGMRGMRERVRQFDGTMKIDSDNTGTRISFWFPISSSPAAKSGSLELKAPAQ